ncbi:MAG TPA: methyltransferase domain-containing protein [Actinomycetota bacterium]
MGQSETRARADDYEVQAATYDRTRGASPTVVRALAKYLGPADGRRLLDIAGGTGNYAHVFGARGFHVFVADRSLAMLAHAARKLGPGRVIEADAHNLPIRGTAVDAAMIVNALPQFHDPSAALSEARRVIRGGPLAICTFTRETLGPLFVYEYFEAPPPARPSIDQLLGILTRSGFTRVEHEMFVYTDTVDGTIPALHTKAHYLAGPAYLRNTSFWYRVDQEARRKGLEALEADLRSGVLEERVKESYRLAAEHGHGTIFAAWP